MRKGSHTEQLRKEGFCILEGHLSEAPIERCREAFWPLLVDFLALNRDEPNRGPHRHFLPMPFDPPCFSPEFFFDEAILGIVLDLMDDRIVADQWGCDVPLFGSTHQQIHADYQRPLFPEAPDLLLPVFMLIVSFGLVDIGPANGAMEIAPGTHCLPRTEALRRVESSNISLQPISLKLGDVLIRHPWALHRGTPNLTDTPRALLTIRYVRRWYADSSREVKSIPRALWEALTPEQRSILRFPISDA